MERHIPYILHQADFSIVETASFFLYLMYYCNCVIVLNKYIYIVQLPGKFSQRPPLCLEGEDRTVLS